MKATDYPSAVLKDRLEEKGFTVRCLWEVKGDGRTKWLTCYKRVPAQFSFHRGHCPDLRVRNRPRMGGLASSQRRR